ncbi:MAG: energy transducer TonB [Rhodospirillales bacterium]
MGWVSVLRFATLNALLFWVSFAQTNPPCDRTIAVKVAEATFRRIATRVVHPTYPQEAITARVTGVVVVDVCVAAGSDKATSIRVLTAPNAAIGEAVKTAVSQWRFGTFSLMSDPGKLHAFASTVVYYFIEREGQWLVLSPSESFYVGPKFALKQQSMTLTR